MPTIGYYSNVILIEWKWLHRSGVLEKFFNFEENKALKFLNISNNFNTFNIQQGWKVNAMFKQVKCLERKNENVMWNLNVYINDWMLMKLI